jgi:hypothetical protein
MEGGVFLLYKYEVEIFDPNHHFLLSRFFIKAGKNLETNDVSQKCLLNV